MRDVTSLAGRHADPVDQADAILWTTDVRWRAGRLCGRQDEILHRAITNGPESVSNREVSEWMADAYELLREVARG